MTDGNPWWQRFADPALQALVARLHAANPQIDQARARLAIAAAAARMGRSAGQPRLGADAGAATAQGALINAAGNRGNLFTARAGASWEIDLFGRLRGERAAERADADASAALLAGTRLALEGQLVRRWLALSPLQANAEDARTLTALAGTAAGVTARQRAAGLRSQAEEDEAQARLAAAIGQQAQAEQARDAAASQIGLLLGDPAPVPLPAAIALPPALPDITPGLPAALLARRPDIAAARSRVLAADQRLRSARQSWLPALTLTASGGAASPSLGTLLGAGAASLLAGALFSIPVFDGGARRARIAGRSAEHDLAAAQYRDQVLAALHDVDDRLGAYRLCRAGVIRARAAEASADALRDSAHNRAARGTISQVDGIAADMLALQRRIARRQDEAACAAAAVDVMLALGGTA